MQYQVTLQQREAILSLSRLNFPVNHISQSVGLDVNVVAHVINQGSMGMKPTAVEKPTEVKVSPGDKPNCQGHTQAERQEAIQMKKNGIPLLKIAGKFGVGESTIHRWTKGVVSPNARGSNLTTSDENYYLRMQIHAMVDAGKSNREIRDAFPKLSKGTISNWMYTQHAKYKANSTKHQRWLNGRVYELEQTVKELRNKIQLSEKMRNHQIDVSNQASVPGIAPKGNGSSHDDYGVGLTA